jgi:hypothetical protein
MPDQPSSGYWAGVALAAADASAVAAAAAAWAAAVAELTLGRELDEADERRRMSCADINAPPPPPPAAPAQGEPDLDAFVEELLGLIDVPYSTINKHIHHQRINL